MFFPALLMGPGERIHIQTGYIQRVKGNNIGDMWPHAEVSVSSCNGKALMAWHRRRRVDQHDGTEMALSPLRGRPYKQGKGFDKHIPKKTPQTAEPLCEAIATFPPGMVHTDHRTGEGDSKLMRYGKEPTCRGILHMRS